MIELVARARGLAGRLLSEELLVDVERARDVRSLAAALRGAGITTISAPAVDATVRRTLANELALLVRWTGERNGRRDTLAVIELDEDRRSLRGILRGLAAGVAPDSRLEGAIATSHLPERALTQLATAATIADLQRRLARLDHPFSRALIVEPGAIDLVAGELALARAFAAATASTRETAARIYIAQLIDIENVAAITAFRSRGRALHVDRLFLAGGQRLARDQLIAMAKADAWREQLARTFARTPIASAIFAPAALEDAALTWQLTTQARLRRSDPHGLAAVLHFVLCRRREAERLRRAAWRVAFGGAA